MEGVGFIIGPSICAVLYGNYGYEMTFWLSSIVQLVAEFFLVAFIPKDSVKSKVAKDQGLLSIESPELEL